MLTIIKLGATMDSSYLNQWIQIWSCEIKEKNILTSCKDCLALGKLKVKFSSLMIWGCVPAKGSYVGYLKFVNVTINDARYKHILDFFLWKSIFQQDGAACHIAKIIKTWFDTNEITSINLYTGTDQVNRKSAQYNYTCLGFNNPQRMWKACKHQAA